jgi:hypothetical protein
MKVISFVAKPSRWLHIITYSEMMICRSGLDIFFDSIIHEIYFCFFLKVRTGKSFYFFVHDKIATPVYINE